MATTPTVRSDTRGIVDAAALLSRVRMRRRAPAAELAPYVEHYWLIDWELETEHLSRVLPHPCVNLAVVHREEAPQVPLDEAATAVGPRTGLFTARLAGRGRVSGVQFRPGGYAAFGHVPPAALVGVELPLTQVLPGCGEHIEELRRTVEDDARVAGLDGLLCRYGPSREHLPAVERGMALAERARSDRSLVRVEDLARQAQLSPRALQRLFAAVHGLGPKQLLVRYRLLEVVERVGAARATDLGALAAELGYSDQAHLTREFGAALGTSPAAYVARLARSQEAGPAAGGEAIRPTERAAAQSVTGVGPSTPQRRR